MRTTPKPDVLTTTINQALVTAFKAHHTAERAFMHTLAVSQETDKASESNLTNEEMVHYQKRESEAFKSAEDAAMAAIKAGMEVAQYADHPRLGMAAVEATLRAFKSAKDWMD